MLQSSEVSVGLYGNWQIAGQTSGCQVGTGHNRSWSMETGSNLDCLLVITGMEHPEETGVSSVLADVAFAFDSIFGRSSLGFSTCDGRPGVCLKSSSESYWLSSEYIG
uniref:Uncharacterized protein n=1 Tax=Romanomermis culicivorax TaxID=13658 RepID=A0A915K2L6_ROMCU